MEAVVRMYGFPKLIKTEWNGGYQGLRDGELGICCLRSKLANDRQISARDLMHSTVIIVNKTV